MKVPVSSKVDIEISQKLEEFRNPRKWTVSQAVREILTIFLKDKNKEAA